MITDTGYQGLQKIHTNSELPKKKSKKNALTKEDKKNNRSLASDRVRTSARLMKLDKNRDIMGV